MAAAVSAPVASAAFGMFDLALLFLAFALMLLWTHRDNLDRLLSGAEPRIGGG
jgi:glycerol-3-phosphate acyltransferase PlsY